MAIAYSPHNPLNSYRSQSVLTLTPGELLVKTYDIALSAMVAKDESRACNVLAHLIDCLDFEHQDVALGLFKLYRYCIEQLKKGEFDVPEKIIRDLRDTWWRALGQSPAQGF
jgi:flagellar protein FliS